MENKKAEIEKLRAEGKSIRKIAKELKMSKSTVEWWLNKPKDEDEGTPKDDKKDYKRKINWHLTKIGYYKVIYFLEKVDWFPEDMVERKRLLIMFYTYRRWNLSKEERIILEYKIKLIEESIKKPEDEREKDPKIINQRFDEFIKSMVNDKLISYKTPHLEIIRLVNDDE